MGLLLVSSVAWACTPKGRVVLDSVVEIGLFDSISEKYQAVREAVVGQFGANGFQGESVQIAVTVEGTAFFGLFSNVSIITFDKHCTQTLSEVLNDLAMDYAFAPNPGDGGGEFGGGYTFTPMPEDPFGACFVSPGGWSTIETPGMPPAREFWPSTLVCPMG